MFCNIFNFYLPNRLIPFVFMITVQRQNAKDIFLAGVERVKPANLIKSFVSFNGIVLRIKNLTFNVDSLDNIFVVGTGKASAAMAMSIESILGTNIKSGHIITKYNYGVPLKHISVTEAGHPVPDENGLRGTEKLLNIVTDAGKNDLIMCLISGGGSALMIDVPEECTLNDLKKLSSILIRCGATINEINCIRKHLSNIKGGMLSKAAMPALMVSLILSDVIGDHPEIIASGPTVPDNSSFKDAMAIIEKYNIADEIPLSILKLLKDGFEGRRQETLKEYDMAFINTHNLIVGTNMLALDACKEKAILLGYDVKIVTNTLQGDINDAVEIILESAIKIQKIPHKPTCLLFAGELTVRVTGKGLGGRNQHLALLAARKLESHPGITILSGGTDGSDGPTDCAGAVADSLTLQLARIKNINYYKLVKEFDSYNFFNEVGGHIITGPTMTNVMDLIIVIVD
jgi:glycerate 2-kinase